MFMFIGVVRGMMHATIRSIVTSAVNFLGIFTSNHTREKGALDVVWHSNEDLFTVVIR